jgi:hypothetical protein
VTERTALRSVIVLTLIAVAAVQAQARPFRVCTFSFNSADELTAMRSHLPPGDFIMLNLSPPPLGGLDGTPVLQPAALTTANAHAESGPPPWLMNQCRPDVQCDIVVYSGEFGGRFFGRYGWSVGLQDLEEAACNPDCRGLFHHPQEVFLLACNTLATKDQDSRTPNEYLQVLLDHGFDRASAERVVDLRYGPLGPSFRESLKRIFMGVPRIYGFSSVAPRGTWTAARLHQYFHSKGDYWRYLQKSGADNGQNAQLLRAFDGSSMVQIAGLTSYDPEAPDRGLVCRMYDNNESVAERLRIVQLLFARRDFFSFLPTIEVFLSRHPAETLRGDERQLFAKIQQQTSARQQVVQLVHDLNVSALKMEMAHLALNLQWISRTEFRQIAVDGARQLLAEPLTSEVVDIMCEITKHEPIGNQFRSEDLPDALFQEAEGYRLIDCLAPTDRRVSARLMHGLDEGDISGRLWAAYALSRRLPLDDGTLKTLATHLNDSSDDLRARLEYIFKAQGSLSVGVRDAVRDRDPQLAANL